MQALQEGGGRIEFTTALLRTVAKALVANSQRSMTHSRVVQQSLALVGRLSQRAQQGAQARALLPLNHTLGTMRHQQGPHLPLASIPLNLLKMY